MSKEKVVKKREFPLVNFLDTKLNGNIFDNDEPFITPQYITNNIKHKLRPYQEHALFNLDYTQKLESADYQYNHLLFQMATGSGKTDVMATIMLYMYTEYGYQDFLFVVNTNSVISKTRENLLNPSSEKYLFKSPININGNRIDIKSVTTFPPYPEPGVIYLRLATIQTISNELNSPRENGLTYDELAKHKLIILADEAHHFSATTKNKEEKQSISWENVLEKIRQCNIKNRQFEFTATLDTQNDSIFNKYKDIILYIYELDQFINQGYSKKVYKLQANNSDQDKMLNTVLLSQYRKRIAKKYSIPNFKPVILFKSNSIKSSKNASQIFADTINELDVNTFINFIKKNQYNNSNALKMTYDYWIKQDPAKTIVELKNDFKIMNTINVNDSDKKGIINNTNNFKNLNSLESPENPFRVIFAVAKLSEGWDVLNLYDIVRIGEQPITLKQTNSEAQLIGRGARYNPFIFNNKKSFTRRFDKDNNELQLLESLYYHTINDSKYIDNLKKSVDAMNLIVEDDNDYDVLETKVKPGFLKSKIYKYGNIYYNELEEVPKNSYSSLKDYGVDIDKISEVNMVNSTFESTYNSNTVNNEIHTELRFLFKIKDEQRLLKKAMSRNTFFRFNSLKEYIPTLKSLKEFMTSNNWLGNIRLYARVNNSVRIDINDKLIAIEKYLEIIQKQITNNYQKKRGTNKFKSIPIKSIIKDYKKTVHNSINKGPNIPWIRSFPMNGRPWYVFEDAIVDQLEKSAIDVIGSFINNLNNKYEKVYLLRNDENNSKIKLHQFDNNVSNYNGFMPDFILYLQNENYIYQVYIEPKGPQLTERDAWKQQLLSSINPKNIEIIGDNENVKLYGTKFFLKGDKNNIQQELIDKKIL